MDEVIVVAPREIVDLAARVARVAGLDAGIADLVASAVLAREIRDGSGITDLLDSFESATVVAPVSGSEAIEGDEQRRAAAFRDGVTVDRTAFDRLEIVARRFLISEERLDALDLDRTGRR